jgi:hypothetical protein
MTLKTCPRENEIRDFLGCGQWLQAAPPELLAHAADCRSCSDLILVANAFQKARDESSSAARLVPPGILWWRAQLRRRNAAVERLARPLLSAQIFALAVTLLAIAGFAAFEARNGVAWLVWLQRFPQNTAMQWDNLRSAMLADPGWSLTILLPVLCTLILLGGIAVYMATDRQ